nr:reverse transcriptase domain-containing protein [Tanacetum cinerariifolium]
PRTSVKGQTLADFLTEIPGDILQAAPAAAAQEEPWTLFTDGSSCVDGSGAGLILTNPEGVNVDSKLVANQVLVMYVAKEDNMIKYLEIVRGLVSGFTTFSISQVPRSKNKQADAISKIASTSFAHLSKQVLVEVLENKSIKEKEVAAVIEEDGPTWMTHIADYLKEGVLPGDNKEARKLRLKARQYELREGVLYRRSFLTPWLRCVGPLQADYVMREIHEGSCSMHAGPRSVVAKAIRLGYYWPTMHKDARDMIRKFNDCQIHRPVTRHPQQSLTPITAPWPFYKWGIDIAGPFSEGPGKVKFLIVPMDYFTKRVEAKAVATITGGQVKSLREGIKARLGEGNKNWVEELPHALWAHRTMIKSSHGDTPFSLTYDTEAVIPAEIGMPTYRTAAVDMVKKDKELRLNLDLLEERREPRAKSKMMKYYNARVRGVAFKPGPLQADYVMREIHEGSCSMHAGPRSVVAKAIRLGYYWPTMHKDARDMIRKCSDCQIHRPVTRYPQQPLTPITAPWPFYKWGIDIAGPFPEGPGKVKFLIVAMDYFTKWIEAKAVETITGGQVKKFVWDNIICRFVIPAEIRMPTYRIAAVDVVRNNEELRLNLDLLEERRERAAISKAKAKTKMMKYYNARVRGVAFKPGDFVYRSNDAKALGNGAYKLWSTDGTVLPRTWNVTNLKRCYL